MYGWVGCMRRWTSYGWGKFVTRALETLGRARLAPSTFVGCSNRFSEGYRKVWAKLRVEGRRSSKERVRRLMREHDLQAPQRAGHAHGPKAHDGTITTEAPDVMWGTDAQGNPDKLKTSPTPTDPLGERHPIV